MFFPKSCTVTFNIKGNTDCTFIGNPFLLAKWMPDSPPAGGRAKQHENV
jgi:hypothetical protein